LSYERGNVSSVGREMGVPCSTIYRWRKELLNTQSQEKDLAIAALGFWWYMCLF
jgi:transposase-like protein